MQGRICDERYECATVCPLKQEGRECPTLDAALLELVGCLED